MNLANSITIARILLVPLYLIIFYSSNEKSLFLSGIILVLSGVTDVLDGYVARKYDMVTKLGTILDPIADKLTTFSVLISFAYTKLIPNWILVVLGTKELLLILGGGILYCSKRKAIPADKFGKMATTTFYIAVISLAFSLNRIFVNILLYTTVILHLIAFINYYFGFHEKV